MYLPELQRHGYDGWYADKESGAPEGCALFIRKDRFEVLDVEFVSYRECSKNDPSIAPLLKNYGVLKTLLCEKLGTVAQFAWIRDRKSGDPPECSMSLCHLQESF